VVAQGLADHRLDGGQGVLDPVVELVDQQGALGLELALLGDVGGDPHMAAERAPGVEPWPAVELDHPQRPVGPAEAPLEADRGVGGAGRRAGGHQARPVLRIDRRQPALAQQAATRAAQGVDHRLVDEHKPAVGAAQPGGHGRAVGDFAVAFLAQGQPPLGGAGDGHVVPGHRDAVAIGEGAHRQEPGALAGSEPQLGLDRPRAGPRPTDQGDEGAVGRQLGQVVAVAPDQVLASLPEKPRGDRVAVADPPVGVEAEEAPAHPLGQLALARGPRGGAGFQGVGRAVQHRLLRNAEAGLEPIARTVGGSLSRRVGADQSG
jgi:hypothetical protein